MLPKHTSSFYFSYKHFLFPLFLFEPPLPHDKSFLVAKGFKKFGGRSQIDPRNDSRVPHPFVFGS